MPFSIGSVQSGLGGVSARTCRTMPLSTESQGRSGRPTSRHVAQLELAEDNRRDKEVIVVSITCCMCVRREPHHQGSPWDSTAPRRCCLHLRDSTEDRGCA